MSQWSREEVVWEDFEVCGGAAAADSRFANNRIMTSKYTSLGMLPKFVFQQFMDIRMQFFMFANIASHSKSSPTAYYSPFLALFLLEAFLFIVEIYNESKRRNYDRKENSRLVHKYYPLEDVFAPVENEKICIGDLILIFNDMQFSADVILLKSSHAEENIFISTSSLDGESGIKERRANKLPQFESLFSDFEYYLTEKIVDSVKKPMRLDICSTNSLNFFKQSACLKHPDAHCDASTSSTSFGQIFTVFCQRTAPLPSYSTTLSHQSVRIGGNSVDNKCLIHRGSILKHTKAALCLVAYTGHDTMIMTNATNFSPKSTHINLLIDRIISLLIAVCVIGTIWMSLITHIYRFTVDPLLDFYFDYSIFVGYFILFFTFTPLSFYIIKMLAELIFIKQLRYDRKLSKIPRVNNPSAIAQAGKIDIICSDKTGTLTENQMILRFICVKSSDGSFYKVDMNQCDYLTDEFIINNTEYQSIFRCILLCNSATLNPEFSSLRRDTNTANQEYYLCTNQDDEALLVGLLPRDIKISSVKGNSIGLVYKCYSEVFYRTDRGIDPDAQHFFQIKVFCDQFKNFYAFIKGAPERVIEFIKRSTLPKNYDAEIKKMNIQCYRLLTLGHAHFDHLPSKEELLSVNTYEFLGMTAVEDKLSPQVCETIRDLQKANIKISIITGDNHNTAHNVAKKCGIICEDSDSCAFRPHYGYFDLEQVKILDKNEYGILDSEMTKQALKNPKIFYSKIKNCKAMIFCRASAVTKSNIVEFYKNTQDLKVLAIGDGFNDISMIKNAHLGIGLAGKEGKMAYNSSDIAINSFRDLSRLIIVHGHKWYEGMFQGTMLLFFKTIFYGFIMLLFCISSHFELVMVFESLSLVLYNGPIMILPILTLYTCNQSISDDDLESYPSLYYEQTYSNTKYSKLILKWVTNALLQASLTFLILQIFLFQSNFQLPSVRFNSLYIVKSTTLLATNLFLSVTFLSRLRKYNMFKILATLSLFWTNLIYLAIISAPLPKFADFLSYTNVFHEIFQSPQIFIILYSISVLATFSNISSCHKYASYHRQELEDAQTSIK